MLSAAISLSANRPVPARRWLLAMTVVLLAAIFLASPNFCLERGPDALPFAGDFLQEWIGGYVVRSGDYARFYDVAYVQQLEHDEALVGTAFRRSEYFPLVYPPFYYLLVSPLSWLPFPVAALLWAGLMVLAYVAAWKLFEKYAGVHSDVFSTAWLLPLSLLFMPLIENFTTCQKGSMLLLILAATYALLVRQKPYWAGLVFGLIAFKPQFALPIAIAMLCKRQWRFVLGGLTSGSVLVTLCLLMGVDVCRQYVEFSAHAGEYLQNSGYDLTKSHTWSGFFALLLGGPSPATTTLTLVASGGTIGLTGLALHGPLDARHPRFAWQYSAVILATVLLSPHLYTYDLTVLLLPLAMMATRADASAVQKWLGLSIFCLVGLSPQIALLTNIQLSVPLLLAFLWAQQKAAGEVASGYISTRCKDRLAASSTL
jgi:hypothetical protein